ncbi:hypothetical protein MKW92_001492, partial [Papaver armeniacum]
LNTSSIKVLQARDDLVSAMKYAAAKKLLKVSDGHHHGFLGELFEKVGEEIFHFASIERVAVLLRCRKADMNLVNKVLDSAKQEYASKAGVHKPKIIVDNDVFLPPAPSHHNEHGLHW